MRDDTRTIDELIGAQKPGYALEQRFYTDSEIYDLELDRIVLRNWILAGHESQWTEPGDFRVFNVANESAIIVRGDDGSLHGFANVCRHRGSLICLEASGNTRKFTCPYHGWTYDTDGKLIAARSMPDGFDKSAYGLPSISVDTVGSLVFVCFSDVPPSLQSTRRDLAEPMAMFDFQNLKVAAQKRYPLAANWKLSVENYMECYHCATAHPEYARMHTLMLDVRKRDRMQGQMKSRMQACGLEKIEFDFCDMRAAPGETGYDYRRMALFDGYLTGSQDGQSLAPLLGELSAYDGGASDMTIGPFSFFLAYSDHVVCYVFTPVQCDESVCEIYWLVRADADEGTDYNVDELTWLWDITTEADRTIIANNARGVRSRFYQPGPFSEMESAEQRYVEWIVRELQCA